MNCEKKDLESSISPHSINEANFPFQNLPVLVQWKILRQYIPILCKAFVLQDMPEFSNLLKDYQSWTKPSKKFFNFFSLLCSLKKGLYINSDIFSKKAYYVSMDQKNITFTLCRLDYTLFDYEECAISSKYPLNPFKRSWSFSINLSRFQRFLKIFLNNYDVLSIDNAIKVYKFRRHFFINYLTNKVHWFNGKVYDIVNRMCFINICKLKVYQIILKDNYMIILRIFELVDIYSDENDDVIWKDEILEPIFTEKSLLSKKQQINSFRPICKIKFHFKRNNRVKLTVKTDNLKMCLDYLDETLLDCLSEIKRCM